MRNGEAMNESQSSSNPDLNIQGINWRQFFGVLFVGLGVVILGWAISQLYQVFNNPQLLQRFQAMIPNALTMTVSIKGQPTQAKVLIPSEMLTYTIPALVLALSAGVGKSFLSAGVSFLKK